MRRAKLYYLRDRKGKSARIAEKIKKKIGIDISAEPVETKEATNDITKKEEIKTEKKPSTQNLKEENKSKK